MLAARAALFRFENSIVKCGMSDDGPLGNLGLQERGRWAAHGNVIHRIRNASLDTLQAAGPPRLIRAHEVGSCTLRISEPELQDPERVVEVLTRCTKLRSTGSGAYRSLQQVEFRLAIAPASVLSGQ